MEPEKHEIIVYMYDMSTQDYDYVWTMDTEQVQMTKGLHNKHFQGDNIQGVFKVELCP